MRISAVGDRLLNALVPKRSAAACNLGGSYWACTLAFRSGTGPYSYYYHQWLGRCYVYQRNWAPACSSASGLVRSYAGCC